MFDVNKFEKFQLVTLGALLAVGLIFSTKLAVKGISGNVISVTGSAYEVIKSDSGTLDFEISVKKPTKQEAYSIAQNQIQVVRDYLKSKGIEKVELKTVNGYYSYKRDSRTGNYTEEREAYNLSQPIKISSDNVLLIKEIFLYFMFLKQLWK